VTLAGVGRAGVAAAAQHNGCGGAMPLGADHMGDRDGPTLRAWNSMLGGNWARVYSSFDTEGHAWRQWPDMEGCSHGGGGLTWRDRGARATVAMTCLGGEGMHATSTAAQRGGAHNGGGCGPTHRRGRAPLWP